MDKETIIYVASFTVLQIIWGLYRIWKGRKHKDRDLVQNGLMIVCIAPIGAWLMMPFIIIMVFFWLVAITPMWLSFKITGEEMSANDREEMLL